MAKSNFVNDSIVVFFDDPGVMMQHRSMHSILLKETLLVVFDEVQ